MEYRGVIPKDLATDRLWPQIAALVERALPYGRGEYSLDDIRAGIKSESLFAAGVVQEACVRFVVICAVCQYPQKRVLYVVFGAGREGELLRDSVLGAARTLGCDWIETRCRSSVVKLFARAGFDTGYNVCILEV